MYIYIQYISKSVLDSAFINNKYVWDLQLWDFKDRENSPSLTPACAKCWNGFQQWYGWFFSFEDFYYIVFIKHNVRVPHMFCKHCNDILVTTLKITFHVTRNSSIVRRFDFKASSRRIESRHVKLVTVGCARDWFAEQCFEFENKNNWTISGGMSTRDENEHGPGGPRPG